MTSSIGYIKLSTPEAELVKSFQLIVKLVANMRWLRRTIAAHHILPQNI